MQEVKFGTDGWRAVIGDAFTFEKVRVVAQAISDYLRRGGRKRKAVAAVGYDTRFLSAEFAREVSTVLAANGIRVILSGGVCSTPALSLAVQKRRCAAGIMITASHNPPRFSGIKFKSAYGGPADPSVTVQIERRLGRRKVRQISEKRAINSGLITRADLKTAYFRFIKSYLNWALLKKAKFRVLIDSMYGAGDDYFAEILADTRCRTTTIHNAVNPGFGGVNPEPIERNLGEMIKIIRSLKERFDIGIATDGDADRVGAVEPNGAFVDAHKIFALMLLHLLQDRGWRGGVGKTVSTTSLINRIAARHGLKLYETPVGFKYITQLLVKGKLLIGGEESGGFGFRGYLRERDGVISGLLLLEMMAQRKQGISELIKGMEREYGRFCFLREDLEYPDRLKKILVKRLLKKPLTELAGRKVVRIQSEDGIKFIAGDDSWMLMRLSGTEPILRIYVEAPRKKQTEKMMKQGKDIAFTIDKR